MITNYTLDTNADLSQILSDGTNTHYYGEDRLAQEQEGQSQFFLGDGLGSARQMTDGTEAIDLERSVIPYRATSQTLGSM